MSGNQPITPQAYESLGDRLIDPQLTAPQIPAVKVTRTDGSLSMLQKLNCVLIIAAEQNVFIARSP